MEAPPRPAILASHGASRAVSSAGGPVESYVVPTREAVLAARSPADLFGAAAADPRALRAAYAALVRAFPGDADPEVFGHVRALFEAARDRRPAPSEAPPASAAELLQRAASSGDAGASLELLASRSAELVATAPQLVVAVIHSLVVGPGPRLAEHALDTVELLIARVDLAAPPEVVADLTYRAALAREIQRLGADPDLPPCVAALCEGCWGKPLPDVARVWATAAADLRDTDLGAVLRRLGEEHPAVLGWLRAMDRAMEAVASPLTVPEPELARLRTCWPPRVEAPPKPRSRQENAVRFWALFATFAAGATAGAAGALVAGALPEQVPQISLAAGCAVPGTGLACLAAWRSVRTAWRRWSADPSLAPARELAAARGLFPHEVAVLLAPAEPLAWGPRRPYGPDHPLVLLARELSLAVFGPAHVDRIVAGAARG